MHNGLEANCKNLTTALEQAMKTQSKLSQNVIRVFFSSPFGGLESEREELTKKYWPQLQSLCSSHGYTFVPVDLRWGISSDLSANASTIKICLSEIDRSNIFVGFFGQRYGWHGENELLQRTFDIAEHDYPWLAEYRGKSVTELEFLHGHLRQPGRIPACFYFRNKAYDDKMLAQYEAEGNEREMRKYKAITDGPHAADLLEDLKRRVYETRDKCVDLCMSYQTPREAAKMMFQAVNTQIKKMLAAATNVDLSQREVEKAKHDAFFVKQCSIGGKYVGGDDYLQNIDDLVSSAENKSREIVITGSAGSGKTALLCNWIDIHSKKSPQDIIVYHFIGCASETTDPNQILSRIYDELDYEFQKGLKPSTDPAREHIAYASAKDETEPSEVLQVHHQNNKESVMQNSSASDQAAKSSISGIFSCFRGSKVSDESSDDVYEKSKTGPIDEADSEDEKQSKKAEGFIKTDGRKTSNEKFSPKDLLPKGGGNHSIQKILANIIQLTQKISEAARKVFIVIDALNKTDDVGKTGKVLFWLPCNLPSNVHLIVSTRTEHQSSMEVLVHERTFDAVEVSALDDLNKETIAKNMLAIRGKEFSEKQMIKVVAAEQTRNPLYLKIFLEEMCSFGDFFLVDKQMDHLLEAESTKILFLKFIKRMELDYNPRPPEGDNQRSSRNIIKEVLCLIEISNEGLSEEELRAILHIDSGTWSPIFFAMASFILDRGGLYSFAYEDLSIAVNEYYLKNESNRLMFVQKLSNYFEGKFQSLPLSVDDVVPSRISSEFPRLLSKLDDGEKLSNYLTKLCVIATVPSDSPEWFKMMEYWTLTGLSKTQILQAFLTSIEEEITQLKASDLKNFGEEKDLVVTHEKLLPVLLRIATFMVNAGYGKAAIPILLRARELYDAQKNKTESDLQTVELYCNINYALACLYVDLDMLNEAEPVHRDVLNTRERYSDQFENGEIYMATSLYGLSVLEERRKNYDKVDEYNKRILTIYNKQLHPDHEYFANLYNNWGVSTMSSNPSHDKDTYEKAIDYMNRAQKIYESVYFGHLPPQVTVTLNNLALCYRRLGNHDEARKIYKRILAIRIDTLGENHTDVGMVYRNLGTLEYAEEKFDLAIDYYSKSLKIFEAFGGDDHLETALSLENMALVNMALKNWDEAHYYLNKAGEVLHRTGRMNHSSALLNAAMADHYLTNGREQDAYKLFQRLVGTAIAQPRDYAALEYFDRQLPENERPSRPYEHTTDYALERWPDNEMLLRNKINYLSDCGDIDKLMPYLSKAKCSVDVYLTAYSLFVEKRHTAVAMPLLKEGLEHFPENENLLRNMVELSLAFKDYEMVIQCAEKLLVKDPNELFALMFLGRALALEGYLARAKQTFSRGLSLALEAEDEENTAKIQNFLKMLEDYTQ